MADDEMLRRLRPAPRLLAGPRTDGRSPTSTPTSWSACGGGRSHRPRRGRLPHRAQAARGRRPRRRSSSATRWRASRSAPRTPCSSPGTRAWWWTGSLLGGAGGARRGARRRAPDGPGRSADRPRRGTPGRGPVPPAASSPGRSPRWSTSSTAGRRYPATRSCRSAGAASRPADAGPQRRDPRPARPAGPLRGRLVPQPGPPDDPGTFLVTISAAAADRDPPRRARGPPRHSAARGPAAPAGADRDRVRAVLVGGYHGAWVPATALDVPPHRDDLAPFDATPGRGRGARARPGHLPAGHARDRRAYLAGQSARQCGPCVNGLPADGGRRCSGWPPPEPPATVAEVRAAARAGRTVAARARTRTAPRASSPARCGVFADHVEST